MNKIIPLHSLVITVGPSENERNAAIERFPKYEVICAKDVLYELVGEDRHDINHIVYAEVRARAETKLRLGERVIINAANLRRNDRASLARVASDNGSPVFYLVCSPDGAPEPEKELFEINLRDIMRGDGIANVIDAAMHSPYPVPKAKPPLCDIKRQFDGITVIPDVHGQDQAFEQALSWARDRNHYVMMLGDLIDYGPGSLEVMDEAYKLVMRGQGELILGNHERKIARYLDDPSVRLSEGNKVTVKALNELSQTARRKWEGRFCGLVQRASHVRRIGTFVFAHGAVHPDYWLSQTVSKDVMYFSLFGETTPTDARPKLSYEWVKSVPQDTTVIVGHDCRSKIGPHVVENVVFLDTGCGKGGVLTTADLRFTDDGLKLENYLVC